PRERSRWAVRARARGTRLLSKSRASRTTEPVSPTPWRSPDRRPSETTPCLLVASGSAICSTTLSANQRRNRPRQPGHDPGNRRDLLPSRLPVASVRDEYLVTRPYSDIVERQTESERLLHSL